MNHMRLRTPNIANLRKRAAVYGYKIIKADDARTSGFCEYVIYHPDLDAPWEDLPMQSLWGIRVRVEELEGLI